MFAIMKNLVTRKAALVVAGLVGLGSIAAVPQQAQAGFRIGFDIGPRPVYQEQETRVWVQPVYQIVCDRVWVAPTYQTVCDRVWVADRFEDRQVICGDRWHRYYQIQRVLIEPGHYESQDRQVLVADGYWANVDRQVVVSPGHWETRVDRVACNDGGPQLDRVHISFGGR